MELVGHALELLPHRPIAGCCSRPRLLSAPVPGNWRHHQLPRLKVPKYQVPAPRSAFDIMRVGLRSLTSGSASNEVLWLYMLQYIFDFLCYQWKHRHLICLLIHLGGLTITRESPWLSAVT